MKAKLLVQESFIHGLGVFAVSKISADSEITENDTDQNFWNKFRGYNSSCDPNTKLVLNKTTKDVKTFAIRDIDVGEELTVEYKDVVIRNEKVCNCPICKGNQ